MQETGPTVYSLHPRRLECLTVCWYNYKRQHILLTYFETLSVGLVWRSNPRPPAQQTGALSTKLTRRRLDCMRAFKAFDSESIFSELARRHHWTWNDIPVIEASTWKGISNLPIWFFIFKWINGQDRKYFYFRGKSFAWTQTCFGLLLAILAIHCVGCWANLLKHQNVNTFYILPLSENVILPFTVICHLLKHKR